MSCRPSTLSRGIFTGAGIGVLKARWTAQLFVAVTLGIVFTPELARAEADTLAQGDVSIAVFQSIDPFNRYWYHYNHAECEGPCSRFNFNSYNAYSYPTIGGTQYEIPTTIVGATGLRLEFGVLSRLTLSAETQLAFSSVEQPAFNLGDSRIGLKWRAIEGPTVVSFGALAKLPGTYAPNLIGAPGGGQPDLELRTLFGGLAAHRRLFYDVDFGYRMRLHYKNAATVNVTPIDYASDKDTTGSANLAATQTYLLAGPADEVFMDFAVGIYPTPPTLLVLSGNLVNSLKGYNLDDYFLTASRSTAKDGLGRPEYVVNGDPSNILTSLEEDYVRLGVGVLFKAYYNTTAYLNYSYNVLGQNTSAFLVPGFKVPIGGVSFGIEYTFGTRKTEATGTASRSRDRIDPLQALRLDPSHAGSQAR